MFISTIIDVTDTQAGAGYLAGDAIDTRTYYPADDDAYSNGFNRS